MGVTLERVQNKFACIIGELCSEPVVLSQFAIWLDLRLAEYKAKGAISLDCSGDNPEPVWLNGHRLPTLQPGAGERTRVRPSSSTPRNSASQKHTGIPRHSFSSPSSNTRVPALHPGINLHPSEENMGFSDSQNERLSPEIVLIKSEQCDPTEQDSFYSIGMIRDEISSNQTPTRENRKRPAETLTREQSSKIKRAGNISESDLDLTSNQSLLSIISTDGQGESGGTESELNQTDMEFSIIKNFNSQDEDQEGNNSAVGGSLSVSTAESEEMSDAGNHTGPSGIGSQVVNRASSCFCASQPASKSVVALIKSRIVNTEAKSTNAVRRIVHSVYTFESWVRTFYNDTRHIEDIPPTELDNYLDEFYPSIRRTDGGDYDAESFRSIRCYLEIFLKGCNYPCSISKSPKFGKSQTSYHVKRKSIQLAAKMLMGK